MKVGIMDTKRAGPRPEQLNQFLRELYEHDLGLIETLDDVLLTGTEGLGVFIVFSQTTQSRKDGYWRVGVKPAVTTIYIPRVVVDDVFKLVIKNGEGIATIWGVDLSHTAWRLALKTEHLHLIQQKLSTVNEDRYLYDGVSTEVEKVSEGEKAQRGFIQVGTGELNVS